MSNRGDFEAPVLAPRGRARSGRASGSTSRRAAPPASRSGRTRSGSPARSSSASTSSSRSSASTSGGSIPTSSSRRGCRTRAGRTHSAPTSSGATRSPASSTAPRSRCRSGSSRSASRSSSGSRSASLRLLHREGRHGADALRRPHVRPAGPRARDRDRGSARAEPSERDDRDRDRDRAGLRAGGARRGARGDGLPVRRVGAGARVLAPADHGAPRDAEHRGARHRARDRLPLHRDPHRGRAQLPRPRHAAAGGVVGMLSSARSYLEIQPWLSIFPGSRS